MRAYERFMEYVKYPTASDENNSFCPSTPAQNEFAARLAKELQELGIKNARVDKNGYVYASIPSNCESAVKCKIGFISHMDVVREVPFENVCPHIIESYDGSVLNLGNGVSTDPSEFPELTLCKGKTLIVTDGNTLLGADDKAGIAEIMTAAEILMKDSTVKHGEVMIAFTPDEEIGRGADLFDIKEFGADYAYTLDGAGFGEVEFETFNAFSCVVTVNGRSIHPGSAKDKMKNASSIAMEFDSMLPESQRPEYTSGYEGFYHLTSITGQTEKCRMHYILRDHDSDKIAARCDTVKNIAAYLNDKYGYGTVEVTITESYRNMAEVIKANMHLIDTAYEAVRELGGTPVSSPVRGGTDGSRLSFMGLPCPNLGTGSYLHHGRQEFACVEDMDKCTDLVVKLAMKYSEANK